MSNDRKQNRRVTWHDNGRGPRVVIDIGGESIVTTPDLARGLRNDLIAVLDEIGTAAGPSSPRHRRRQAVRVRRGGVAMGDVDDIYRRLDALGVGPEQTAAGVAAARECRTPPRIPPDTSGCDHSDTERGADIPLVHGSHRSEVCKSCGWFRRRDHHWNLIGPYQGRWRPPSEYADQIESEMELDR